MNQNGTTGVKLRPNQRKALVALIDGESIETAAKLADCAENTVYRWMREDATFAAELRTQSLATIQTSAHRLRGNVGSAIGVLVDLMTDTNTAPNVRRAAANDLIGHAVKFTETGELIERLERLEERLK